MNIRTLECDALAGLRVRCADGALVVFIQTGEDPAAAMAAARPKPRPPAMPAQRAQIARRR